MDGCRFSISPRDPYRLIGSAGVPAVFDLRIALYAWGRSEVLHAG